MHPSWRPPNAIDFLAKWCSSKPKNACHQWQKCALAPWIQKDCICQTQTEDFLHVILSTSFFDLCISSDWCFGWAESQVPSRWGSCTCSLPSRFLVQHSLEIQVKHHETPKNRSWKLKFLSKRFWCVLGFYSKPCSRGDRLRTFFLRRQHLLIGVSEGTAGVAPSNTAVKCWDHRQSTEHWLNMEAEASKKGDIIWEYMG